MLIETIRTRLKDAMKAGRTVEKEILRVALGEIQTEEARNGKPPTDPEIEKIFRKLVKSNTETMEATVAPSDKDILRQEIQVLESLLPKVLDEAAIIAALSPIADAIRSAGNDGQATGVAMKQLKELAVTVDGKTVSAAVRQIRTPA